MLLGSAFHTKSSYMQLKLDLLFRGCCLTPLCASKGRAPRTDPEVDGSSPSWSMWMWISWFLGGDDFFNLLLSSPLQIFQIRRVQDVSRMCAVLISQSTAMVCVCESRTALRISLNVSLLQALFHTSVRSGTWVCPFTFPRPIVYVVRAMRRLEVTFDIFPVQLCA